MKMLGRLVGSGHCTCWDCGMPRGRKYLWIRKRREQRTWKRQVVKDTATGAEERREVTPPRTTTSS